MPGILQDATHCEKSIAICFSQLIEKLALSLTCVLDSACITTDTDCCASPTRAYNIMGYQLVWLAY